MKKHLFSLIELLVVVAIIGILASLLLPTLKSARETAKQAQCMSGIRNLNTAMTMFRDDYDGYIAHTWFNDNRFQNTDWNIGVDQYFGGSAPIESYGQAQFGNKGASPGWWACPTTIENTGNYYTVDYGISAGGPDRSWMGYKATVVSKPSDEILLSDVFHMNGRITEGRSLLRTGHSYDLQTSGASGNDFKHGRTSSNYAFIDGHVESIKWLPEGAFVGQFMQSLYALPTNNLGSGNHGSPTYTP
ncbi:type II secretion system protein [Lentisphaera profundi]|uniref:Type II secretion system protein n=1 Tax=Lentisphaera profundi TaxID=1658616 RepID=A0ABY7VRT1_9BACT|nr:type II secretion system protein [Lentisphaera profundi]WDE96439.1 type II secretion system protein [Lentisphaera profundi]